MVPVKIECGCGQRYAFDVEPVNGRMPASIACPACGMDGTSAANEAIAYMLAAQPAAASTTTYAAPMATAASAPPPPRTFAPATKVSAPAAPSPASSYAPVKSDNIETSASGKQWKWWHFILAGICIGGFDGWMVYETGRLKYLNGLFLSVLLIALGVWEFKSTRQKKS